MKNKIEAIIIGLLLIAVAFLLWERKSLDSGNEEKFMAYMDSMQKRNEVMFSKVDSLNTLKHEQFSYYEKINLKYDTIQIALDTMPDIDGTKFLLTISRQLTAKGVE
jgi:hypothetical protein